MDNNLEHAGVKGMRWGVRNKRSADSKSASSLKKKKLKSMTNEELQTYLKRADLEKRYKEHNPSKTNKMKSKIAKSMGKKFGELLDTAAKIALQKAIEMAFESVMNNRGGRGPNITIEGKLLDKGG